MAIDIGAARQHLSRLNLADLLPDGDAELSNIVAIARDVANKASGKLETFWDDATQTGSLKAMANRIGTGSGDHVVKASAPGFFSFSSSDETQSSPDVAVGMPLIGAMALVGLAAGAAVAAVIAVAASEFALALIIVVLLYIYLKSSWAMFKRALERLGSLIQGQ
ncbi:hypothetical protein ACFOD9_03440 [Novosphingobium bradum]|uniref:Phage holin family protein n=1 Tax=Novosphingobium bradum TaxID=1737444 RepID=A0ABV7IR22_9SPHN